MMNNMPLLDVNDLVTEKNGIYSGGFSVNSILSKSHIAPIQTIVVENQHGGSSSSKVSDLFGNLVVPNWALNYNFPNNIFNSSNDNNSDDETEDISEDLHDKLFHFIRYHENEKSEKNKKRTKRFKKYNKKTRNKK
jgi:hypothetical protein